MKKYVLSIVALLFLFTLAQAQIMIVKGDYRVTEVDRSGQRVGIALRDANPNVRQNWVYVKPETKIVKRVFYKNGTFKDTYPTFNDFFDYVRKGTQLKVEGGRDWDKSIHAKKIWF